MGGGILNCDVAGVGDGAAGEEEDADGGVGI